MNDLVSVIIPSYNRFEYLLQAVESVLNQTYDNIEIIIVNDESEDPRYKTHTFPKNCKVIHVNREKIEGGPGSIRNYGTKEATGKYIAFLDADDIWNAEKLKKQVSIMEKKNLSITHTSYVILDKNNNANIRLAKNLDYKKLLKSCDVGLSTVMIKKNLFSKKNKFSNLKTKEDYVLWLLLTKGGYIFYPIKEILTSWRTSQNSLSSHVLRKLIDGFNVYYKYMKFSFIKSIFLLIQLSLNYLWKKLRF